MLCDVSCKEDTLDCSRLEYPQFEILLSSLPLWRIVILKPPSCRRIASQCVAVAAGTFYLDSYIEDIMFSETRQFLRLNINQVQKLSTLYILLVETVGVEPTSQ